MTKSYKDEQAYILNCIDDDEVKQYYTPIYSDKEKTQYLYDRFYNEYEWNVKKIGEFKALVEWLQGLALNIAYNHHEILILYKNWNDIQTMTEKEEEKILEGYWRFMAMRIIGLWNKHNVRH